MEWNKKFNYPSSTRALVQGKRHYSLDGSNLPSVTTILSATKSEEDKAALTAWKERVGKLEAERIKKEASTRGSSIHKFIEEFLHGKLNQDLIDDNNHSKKMAEEIIDNGLKNKLSEVWGAEATLYYPNKYAGTADCIGVYEGRETILDFKQSNKPKKKEWITDYKLQLAAYAMAHNYMHKTEITKGVIMMCSKDNYYQEFVVEGNEFKEYQHKWLGKVSEYYEHKRKNDKARQSSESSEGRAESGDETNLDG